jgi:ORF6N domain
METPQDLLPAEAIERRIVLIRGQKVMLDSALAELYQVSTKVLNQAVKRNLDRFPPDFMFRLTQEEANQSQIVTGSQKHRDPRLLPYAFTEQGVAMLSSVLKSTRAVQVNIAIMRTFVRLRQLLETHRDLADKLQEMEAKYDQQFDVVFEVLNQLTQPESDPKNPIGFVA